MTDETPMFQLERQIAELKRIADGIEDMCAVWEEQIAHRLTEIHDVLESIRDN